MEESPSALAHLKGVLRGQLEVGSVNQALGYVKRAAERWGNQDEAQEALHQINQLVQDSMERLPSPEPSNPLEPRSLQRRRRLGLPDPVIPTSPGVEPSAELIDKLSTPTLSRVDQWRQLLIQELTQ